MNLVMKLINYVESKRESNPKLFKVLLISLWCCAPIEMAIFKFGIFGYKKLSKKYSKKLQEELR